MKQLTLQIFIEGEWLDCCLVKVQDPKRSRFSPASFEFLLEYFFEFAEFEGTRGTFSPSVRYSLNPVSHEISHWPEFLLDLIPQGAARSVVCKREEIVDSEENDFEILYRGAINPVGNVRVKSDIALFKGSSHPGFSKSDLLEKNEDFLEHAEQYNAIVIGTSGAQGVAPKFLLNTDAKNKWHCDGALQDSEVEMSYLVKMPRGKTRDDLLILKTEKTYMDIAKEAGANINTGLEFEKRMLFIPRFDRQKIGGRLLRFGMESLSSAAGHYDFGKADRIENYLKVIEDYSSSPKEDILEFVRRDFLNIVLGNTDNHGRNTAFLKKGPKDIRISPLFDFAPMVMDPEMIARVTKWTKENNYIPDFEHVEKTLLEHQLTGNEIIEFFDNFRSFLNRLPELWEKYKLSEIVYERSTRKYLPFLNALNNFLEKNK